MSGDFAADFSAFGSPGAASPSPALSNDPSLGGPPPRMGANEASFFASLFASADKRGHGKVRGKDIKELFTQSGLKKADLADVSGSAATGRAGSGRHPAFSALGGRGGAAGRAGNTRARRRAHSH